LVPSPCVQRAVESGSLNILKAEIGRVLISKGIKGYGDKAGKWSGGL